MVRKSSKEWLFILDSFPTQVKEAAGHRLRSFLGSAGATPPSASPPSILAAPKRSSASAAPGGWGAPHAVASPPLRLPADPPGITPAPQPYRAICSAHPALVRQNHRLCSLRQHPSALVLEVVSLLPSLLDTSEPNVRR